MHACIEKGLQLQIMFFLSSKLKLNFTRIVFNGILYQKAVFEIISLQPSISFFGFEQVGKIKTLYKNNNF